MPRTSLLVPILLLTPLTAQIARTLPDAKFERIWAGNNGSGVPLGENKCIVQSLFEAPIPANALVSGIGYRRTAGTTDYAGFAHDCEIVLSSTTVTTSTLSTTFANNLGTGTTTVFPRTIVNIPPKSRNSPPSDWIMFPCAAPWIFAGPNIVIQAKAFAPVWAATGLRNDRTFAGATSGEALNFGGNCGTATISSTSTAPAYMPGSTVSVTLAAAPATQPAALMLGNDLTVFGTFALPLDLTIAGLNGCLLHVAPIVSVSSVTDGAGAASVVLPIPIGTPSAPLAFQWFYVDPAAARPVPVSGTNGRYVQIGPRVPGHSYVYDLFDETVATGTLQAGGPIVRILSIP